MSFIATAIGAPSCENTPEAVVSRAIVRVAFWYDIGS